MLLLIGREPTMPRRRTCATIQPFVEIDCPTAHLEYAASLTAGGGGFRAVRSRQGYRDPTYPLLTWERACQKIGRQPLGHATVGTRPKSTVQIRSTYMSAGSCAWRVNWPV